jgi:hypothetical protein
MLRMTVARRANDEAGCRVRGKERAAVAATVVFPD